jgi:integrase
MKKKPAAISVRVVPAVKVKGEPWAVRYPSRANEPWIIAHAAGKRRRIHVGPDTPEAWQEAEEKAQQLEHALQLKADPTRGLRAPNVAAAMDEYLERGMKHLAPSTQAARRQQLSHMREALGKIRLDQLTPGDLTQWWADYVETSGRDVRTGMGHVEALNRVIADAIFHGLDVANTVPEARRRIQERYRRSKALRGRDQRNKKPLTATEGGAFAAKLAEWPDQDVQVMGLLLLDTGMRFGEVLALRWEDCHLGKPVQHFHVCRSVDASGKVGSPKSGQERDVAMSRRLWLLLQERYLACGRPRRHARVLRWKTRKKYWRALQDVCDAAGIQRQVHPKDLRDTYASQLLTMGIPLGYIAGQLGHAQLTTTARHYARWVDQDGYQNPVPVGENEVPADLLARLATTVSPDATKAGESKQ